MCLFYDILQNTWEIGKLEQGNIGFYIMDIFLLAPKDTPDCGEPGFMRINEDTPCGELSDHVHVILNLDKKYLAIVLIDIM